MKRPDAPGYVRRAHRVVYENPWLRFEAHEIVHPNGRPGEHGLVVAPAPVAVVVLDVDAVVLTRQPRFALDRFVLEIVKGGSDAGETPLATARREVREEVGVRAARWDELGFADEIPSIVQNRVSLFLARDLSTVASEPEAVESIDVVRLPFGEVLDMIAAGTICDAVSGLALFRAERFLHGR